MANNHTVTCPHCMNDVPWGAQVCRGCHAEIRYGTPRGVAVFLLILCFIAGGWVTELAKNYITTNSTFLWVVFGAIFLSCAWASRKICERLYDGKAVFRRFYRK